MGINARHQRLPHEAGLGVPVQQHDRRATHLAAMFVSRADFLSRFCLTDEVTVCSDAEERDYSSTAARFHYGHAKECAVSGISRLMVAEEDVLVERRYSFPVGIFLGR